MKIIFLFIILNLSSSIFSQTFKEKYANKLFENMEYYECSAIYEEIADKLIDKQKINYEIITKTAVSFYNIRNYPKSLSYLEILAKSKKLDNRCLAMYFDCLVKQKEFAKIRIKRDLFEPLFSNNYNLLNLKEYQDSISVDSAKYTLSKLSINSGKGEYSAIEHEDNLYFASTKNEMGYTQTKYSWDNSNFSDVYVSSTKSGLVKSEIVKELKNDYHDGPVCFLEDEIYLTRTKYEKIGDKKTKHVGVYYGKIGEKLSALKFNSENYNIGHVAFSNDGKIMYFSSDVPGGFGGSDIYYSLKENDQWGNPINLGSKVNTKGDEMFPFIDSKGGIYFSSNGRIGFGGLDVYYLADKANYPTNLGHPINSIGDDFSFILNKDEKTGYLTSDIENNIDNIYSVRVNEIMGVLKVSAFNPRDNKTIEDPNIYLIDMNSFDTIKVQKNPSGEYLIPVKRNAQYLVYADKKNFKQFLEVKINTGQIKNNEVLEKKVDLTQVSVDMLVKSFDSETKLPLANAEVQIMASNGEVIKCKTNDFGIATIPLKVDSKFMLSASKKGYLDLNTSFTSNPLNPELIVNMVEIKKDVVFKIENILYDLGKADLREISKIELDKLSNFLLINNTIKVELSSHTDSRSTAEFNIILSQKRAQSCLDYLISKGVPSKNIIAKGYGESKLLNNCSDGVNCPETDHQLNRRTEVKILSVN